MKHLLALVLLPACGLPPIESDGCTSDADCKGDRICVEGQCVETDGEPESVAPSTDVTFLGGHICGQLQHFNGVDQVTLGVVVDVKNDGVAGDYFIRWATPGSCGDIDSPMKTIEAEAQTEGEQGGHRPFECPRDSQGLLPVGESSVEIHSKSSSTGSAFVVTDSISLNFGGDLPLNGTGECKNL